MAKKILKIAGICLGVILLAVIGLVGWLTAREYRPEAVENVPVFEGGSKPISVGDSLTVLSQNTGYAGLGADSDFFMDGGHDVAPTGEQETTNRNGIIQQLQAQDADVYFLQEVDVNSGRTGSVDQSDFYWTLLGGYSSAHALNYSCEFVPYPLPPIGKVHSGLQIGRAHV